MLSLNATQLAIVAAANKDEISWLFQIDRTGNDVINDYWSTKVKTWDGHNYTFKVIDFSEIEMNRAQSESGIQAPSEFTFTITNKDNTLTTANFSSARINLLLVVKAGANEAEIRSWSFRITEVDPGYQKLTFHCIDWLQAFLEGDYPDTAIVESLFINPQPIVITPEGWFLNPFYVGKVQSICVPVVLGRPCIPVMPIYIGGGSPYFGYLLGPTTGTPSHYDVYNVKTPSQWDGEAKTYSKADYTFSYIDKTGQDSNDYTCGVFTVIDSDNDGNADANIKFAKGLQALPIPAEYERDDLKTKTAPGDILEYILEAWGIPSAKIDATTQAAANTTYSGWGLTWNIGLFNKEPRKKLLARLLAMCHTELIVRDKIYFKVHSKTSQKTLNKAHIIKKGERGEGTFKYEIIEKKDEKDSGYMTYQVQGECLDHLLKILVTVKGAYNNIASDVISADYVQDSQNAQRIGTLALQRKFLPLAKVSFNLKGTCLALECDDIVTPSHADYGGTYAVLIDSMKINRDLSIDITATRFSQDLDDWGDLTPSAITVVDDDYSNYLQVVIAGPDAVDAVGNQIGNVLPGRLRIGQTGNHILFDPVEPIQTFVEGGVTRMKIGDLGTDDWGIEFLDHAGNSIFKLDGSGVNTIAGWAATDKKLTCQSGQVGMNAEETGGTDWRFWAGHATPGSAPFRVDENGNLYATSAHIQGIITAGHIHIPDQNTTANSFHVNTNGDAWFGCTETNFNADNDNAVAYILKTGVAKFKSVTMETAVILKDLQVGSIIDGQYLANLSVASAAIANLAITAGKIANSTITATQIANSTITGGKIAVSTIDTGNIVNQAITAGLIENLTITASQIANLTITGGAAGKIAASTITEDNIVVNTITAASIAANTITASQIAANTITAAEILANTITATEIAAGTITAAQIAAGTITASQIKGTAFGTLTITSGKIAINTTDALEIQAAGNMKLLAGADIVMTPSDSNPSLIKWSTIHNMGAALTGTTGLCVWPETVNTNYFAIGYDAVNATYKRYNTISMHSYHSVYLAAYYNASYNTYLNQNVTGSTAYYEFYLAHGGTITKIRFNQNGFYPYYGTIDLGITGSRWRNGFFSGYMHITDYLTASGGIHVGGTSDPGTDRLLVDGRVDFNHGDFYLPNLDSTASIYSEVRINTADGWMHWRTSSRRYKNNIKPLEFDTDIVYDFPLVSFDPVRPGTKKRDGPRTFGIIAEDAIDILTQKGLPPDYFVSGHKDKNRMGFEYSQLIIPMLNEMKKLKNELILSNLKIDKFKKLLSSN